ncbi:hypothetical protein V2J09_006465 [Rumex salicifolius]
MIVLFTFNNFWVVFQIGLVDGRWINRPLSATMEEGDKQEVKISFKQLGLCDELVDACANLGWKVPTKIQVDVIHHALEGIILSLITWLFLWIFVVVELWKDIIGLAQTGSGKTGAFALPVLQALLKYPKSLFCCVISPTRELAIQITEQFQALGSGFGLKAISVLCQYFSLVSITLDSNSVVSFTLTKVIVRVFVMQLVGEMAMNMQEIALGNRPHIIVATPGCLLDHLTHSKGFTLSSLKYLVLDEADRLLNEDFKKSVDEIMEVIPRERKTYLFSATMTDKAKKIQRIYLKNPVKIMAASKYSTVDALKQQYLFMPAKSKDFYLVYILTEKAGSSTMVFTRTCEEMNLLSLMLRNLGFRAIPINGHMDQAKRLGALNSFKAGNVCILVCTDVASRGLDIPLVDVVINYSIPSQSKDYIHRVGRTARAGRTGVAISLVNQYELEWYLQIENLIGKKLPQYQAKEEEVMILLDRVAEARRMSRKKMKESGGKRKCKGEDDDDEIGNYVGNNNGKKDRRSSSKKRREW